MRSVGCSASEAASSSRPRRIVFSSTPVISNNSRSAPWPSRCDSTARYHLRCCSSNRLSNRFIWRWYSRSRCSIPATQPAHWQGRTTPLGTPSVSPQPAKRCCAYPTLIPPRPVEVSQKPELVSLQPLSQPFAVLLNEGSEVLAVASGVGFRCFTDVEEFKTYVLRDVVTEPLAA